MSTHLSKTPRFDSMLDHLTNHATSNGDRRLVELFTKHRPNVSAHFESCVPDHQAWMKWTPDICARNEAHGPLFHKGFRQFDVTESSKDDIEIWKLLAGEEANRFWDAHALSMQDQLN